MPFQEGNKLAKGGKRDGSGRLRKTEVEIKKAAAEIARDYIERSVKPVMATYFQLAHGRYVNKWHEGKIVGQEFEADSGTTRHFVDKLLPDVKTEAQGTVINVNFVQFQNNQHTLQLHAEGVPGTVLAGNGNGHQEGVQGLAPPERQGQNGLKFHDFEDVPGE